MTIFVALFPRPLFEHVRKYRSYFGHFLCLFRYLQSILNRTIHFFSIFNIKWFHFNYNKKNLFYCCCPTFFSIRGRLGSLTPLARNIGVLLSYTIGATVQYEFIPAIFIFIPILYMILLFLLPNTSQYYIKKDNLQVK